MAQKVSKAIRKKRRRIPEISLKKGFNSSQTVAQIVLVANICSMYKKGKPCIYGGFVNDLDFKFNEQRMLNHAGRQ